MQVKSDAKEPIRLPPWDPFFAEGDRICLSHFKQYFLDEDKEEPQPQRSSQLFKCQVNGCQESFTSLSAFESHNHSTHGSSCSVCKKNFPSDHLLSLHVSESHDSFFQALPSDTAKYECIVKGCREKFKTVSERKEHLISWHKYPSDFRYQPQQLCKMEDHSTFATPRSVRTLDKVPRSICFGAGASRAFQRGTVKHSWPSKRKDHKTTRESENRDITMKDLQEALDDAV